MQSVNVNDVELEYEVTGAGEPVLLISPVIADGFLPLVAEPALADRYQLIRYHRRGWVGSTHTPAPVSVADHAADAAALLDRLGLPRAHIAGHSTGAAVAMQLALDHPEYVHTLVLLEPSLIAVPSLEAFFKQAAPAFAAYASGDLPGALAIFVSAVSGLEWPKARALLEQRVPGALEQTLTDADTFFGIELPALTDWEFGAEQAAAIHQPVLSMLGGETQPVWVEVAAFLRAALPRVDERTIDGAGHLLPIQRPEPVARAMSEFLATYSIGGDGPEALEHPSRTRGASEAVSR
ncbi:MAG: alpha/beta fold hydrolase [Solirubrobacteraceae bacterium]